MPGGGEILSTECTTQGDPLAMAMYAIAVTRHLRSFCPTVQQVWYADDAAGAGSCDNLKMWFDELNRIGPFMGIILMHPRLASLLNHIMSMLPMKSLLVWE